MYESVAKVEDPSNETQTPDTPTKSFENGCHSNVAPDRFKSYTVYPGNGDPSREGFPYRMSRTCQYDRRKEDPGCSGCGHP